jgi:hypothetical protein
MGIYDGYWIIDYEFIDEIVDEENFPQLVNEFFSKLIGYTVSKCVVKPIEIEGKMSPHCLRFELTKETDSGVDIRVFSVVPAFWPCTFCRADMQINVLYKTGNATIKELLIANCFQKKKKEKKVKQKRVVDVGNGWFEVKKK